VKARPTIRLTLRDRGELLECFFHHGTFDGVFVPQNLKLRPGTEVNIELELQEDARTFHVRGVVKWNRRGAQGNNPAGLGVTFLDSERRTRDLLIDYAKGRTVTMAPRQENRVGVAVQVEYQSGSAFLKDMTDDLSESGAFIASNEPMEIGQTVDLALWPPNCSDPLRIRGEVVWAHADERPGFGVKFLFDDDATRAQIARVVEELRAEVAAKFGVPEA